MKISVTYGSFCTNTVVVEGILEPNFNSLTFESVDISTEDILPF